MKENNHYCSYSHFSFHICWEATITNWLRCQTISQLPLSSHDQPSSCPHHWQELSFSTSYTEVNLLWTQGTLGSLTNKWRGFRSHIGDMLKTMHRTGIHFPIDCNPTRDTWTQKTHMPVAIWDFYTATNTEAQNCRIYYPPEPSCCSLIIWANQLQSSQLNNKRHLQKVRHRKSMLVTLF